MPTPEREQYDELSAEITAARRSRDHTTAQSLMRFAYADPPYPGQGKRYEHQVEVNHPLLIAHLETFDGWALSTSSPALAQLLPLCPGARVAAWVKPFAHFKPGVRVAYSWEPVIFRTPNKTTDRGDSVPDSLTARINQNGFAGSKSQPFCFWLFQLLDLAAQDTFEDIFPGSRAVSAALAQYRRQHRITGQLRPKVINKDQYALETQRINS